MLKKLWSKIEWRFLWRVVYPGIWILKGIFFAKKINKTGTVPFSIGMVTYVVRFKIFKKNFMNLHKNFSDVPIIICVNGYYDKNKQEQYLVNINNFLKKFENVTVVTHVEPQALSKLWNQIILYSKTEKFFIFNDDIEFSPYTRRSLLNSSILQYNICTINSSWSHFLLSKNVVKKVGWFDERLFGVGGEDWDYEARLAFAEIETHMIKSKQLLNKSILTKDFSYGKEIDVVEGKYTKSSSDFLFRKWEVTTKEDKESKYLWERYIKPIKGMETPNFYPDYFSSHKSE